MLKTRIIPKLLLSNGRNVKGVNFVNLRDTGSPVSNARIYDDLGADELIFLDISENREKRALLFDLIKKVAQEVFMPLCVGGGVSSIVDIRNLLLSGADKVAINTAAIEIPSLISEGASIFGRQCIVVSIDYRDEGDFKRVYSHGGKQATQYDVFTFAKQMEELGAGEILLTSIDRDGTMAGYDTDTLHRLSAILNIPIIASGGAGTLAHLVDAVKIGKASAVAVGSLFHFTDQSPIKARSHMKVGGINVRIEC